MGPIVTAKPRFQQQHNLMLGETRDSPRNPHKLKLHAGKGMRIEQYIEN